jgi:hypothetical protein
VRKTYHGSCHCGVVRFSANLDLEAGTSRCNCSACTKARFWKATVPAGDFRLIDGEEALSEYRFGRGGIAHLFCRDCGIKPFGRGEMEELGGAFYAVNIACLDDAGEEELANAPITYEDGKHDAWDRAPAVTSYL